MLPGVHPDVSGCHPGVKPDLSGCHPAALLHPAYQQLPHLQDYQVNYIYIQQFYDEVSQVNFFLMRQNPVNVTLRVTVSVRHK